MNSYIPTNIFLSACCYTCSTL